MILTTAFVNIQTNTASLANAALNRSFGQSRPVGPDRCPATGNPCGPINGIGGGFSQCCVRCGDGTRRNFQATYGRSFYRNENSCQNLANNFCGCIVVPTAIPTIEPPITIPAPTLVPPTSGIIKAPTSISPTLEP